MTEFASAIADLRLSGEKLNQDANAVRAQLLRLTQQLEQQAQIQLSVGIDLRRAQRDLANAVASFTRTGAFNISVGLDADKALDDLAAFKSFDDPLVVPVVVDTDQALDDLATIDNIARLEPAVLPLTVEDDEALLALDRIKNQSLPDVEDAFAVAGDSAGRQFADRLGQTVFSAVGTLSLGLGAFVTTSLVRGFQRFTTIEDATASLTVALESSTEAALVLDDVLDVVTGTPFNLDQFANAASNLISFGVEAEKVPGFLEAIAEASASRGGRANEFAQRLATTFGQISVQGRITGEDILSLQATGVDALRILGNAFGETTIDVRELISQGIIPADEALDILATGILEGSEGINGATVAFAGTAERLRETLTGARGGFISATARFGVAIIEPFEEALTAGFNSATDIVNQFTKEINSLLGGLATTDGFDSFVENIKELPDLIDPVLEQLAEFGPALAPLAAGFGALGINQLTNFLAPLGLAIPQINGLVLAITALVATTPELREAVLPILGDLGEAAAIVSAGLGVALGDALEAITPLLVEFAEAVADFTPFITDLATFGAALARGFVPVIEGLAEVLDFFPVEVLAAIGGGLLAFRGLNALTGPVDNLTQRISNFGAQLQLAEANSERFGTRFTAAAQRFGVSGQTITRAAGAVQTGLDSAASAAAGFFSGFALAAEDATTQALGFASAATSIATGFATGGPVGGIVASAAVVGGALVKTWTDSKQAAEEYERTIDRVAQEVIDDLGAATAALLTAQELLNQEPVVDQAIDIIGQEDLELLQQYGVDFDTLLQAAADGTIGAGLNDAIRAAYDQALTDTNIFIAERRQLTGDVPTNEEAAAEFARVFQQQLQGQVDAIAAETGLDLSGLLDATEVEGAVSSVTNSFDLLNDPTGVIGTARTALQDLFDLATDTQDEIGDELARDLARLDTVLGDFGRDFDLDDEQLLAFRDASQALNLSTDDVRDAIRESDDEIQAYLDNSRQLAEVGLTPWDLILRGVEGVKDEFDILVEVNDDGTLTIIQNAEDTAAAIDGITGSAEALTAALEAADAVAKRFTEELDRQLSILDEIAREQDFVAGFEAISASLGEIINQDELDDAQDLIDKIGDGRESIADLQAQLADEEADANREVANLNRRIADAQAFGATEGAAALIAERDRVLRDVEESRRDIQDQINEVAELEAEVARLSQAPITLEQLLRSQAADAGLSFAEFLISPNASPEAREFFQGAISSQLQQFGGIIQAAVDENPLLASIQIPDLTEQFVQSLSLSGLDEATARELVDRVFDPTVLAREARNSFDEAFAADLATLDAATQALLRGEEIDPSINVEATVEDVGNGIAALAELERQGIEIPGGIDLLAAQETLSSFTDAYESSDFSLLIPVEGDLSIIEEQLLSLENYTIQLDVQRNAPDGLGPTFGNSARPQPPRWWERNFNSDLSNPTDRFRLPGGGFVFLDGGFYGKENHVAQIGSWNPGRFWGEPETGGEAYIPLGNSKRSRSTQILTSVADIFGMDVIPRARGAAAAAKSLDEGSMARAVETGVRRAGVPGAAARAKAHDRAARSVNVEKIEVSGVRDPNAAVRKMIRSLSDVALGMTDWDEF